jgi:hypothetical protein
MSIGQKQHVAALRFYLYDRPVHPELFDIYHDHQVAMKGYEAQIWVTGCTHAIGFFHERNSLLEITSDAENILPQRGRLLDMPFRGEKQHECTAVDGVRYMMNFQVESMSPGVYSKMHHELAKLGAQRGLFVPFPTWRSRALTPFTYIDYDARANELHVFAFHAFPEDLTMVKTQSIFGLA